MKEGRSLNTQGNEAQVKQSQRWEKTGSKADTRTEQQKHRIIQNNTITQERHAGGLNETRDLKVKSNVKIQT